MRYTYLIIFFLFFNFFEGQTSGTLIYRITSEESKSNEENSQHMQGFFSFMNSLDRLRDSLFFNLDFNDKESIFFLDKKKNIGISNEKGYNVILKSHGSSRYYRNDEERLLIEELNSDALYLIKSSVDSCKWQITKEMKKINNYACFKAIAKVKSKSPMKGEHIKEVEAWYCPEIAINLGPLNYGGLPGLIVELKDRKFTYYLYSINLNSNPIIERPFKGKVVTKEQYYNMIPHITRENFNEYIGN